MGNILVRLFMRRICLVCNKPVFLWQKLDWCPGVGADIHVNCVTVYPFLTPDQKQRISEGHRYVVPSEEYNMWLEKASKQR